MRKIFLTIAFSAVVATTMNAQDKKAAPMQATVASSSDVNEDARVNSKMELLELSKVIDLNSVDSNGLYQLIDMKNQIMNNKETPLDRKKEFAKIFEEKLKATLDTKSYEKLRANKDFYNKMIQISPEGEKKSK